MEERTRSRSNSASPVNYSWSRTTDRLFTKASDPQGWGPYSSGGPFTGSIIPVQSTEVMNDFVHDNFKLRRSKGEIIMSPMVNTKTLIENGPSSYNMSYEERGGVGTSHPCWYRHVYTGTRPFTDYLFTDTTWPTTSFDTAGLEQLALAKAFSNISATDALLYASLGEAKETLQSARKALKTVIKLVKKFKRSRWAGLADSLQHFGNYTDAWMSLRYELRPLYYDLLGYAKVLKHNKAYPRQTFRGFAEEELETITYYNKTVGGIKFTMKRTDVIRVRARGGVLTEVGSLNWMDYVGVYDVAESVWELIPLSFIVDWFCNIGLVISSWTPNPSFETLGSWVTVETVTSRTIEVSDYIAYPVYSTDKNGSIRNATFSGSPYYRKSITRKERKINPERIALPIEWKLPFNLPKMLDLILILAGLNGRH